MFFALEVLLRRFGTRSFNVIVLSSVVATVTAIQLRGDEFAIPVVTHHVEQRRRGTAHVVLGVLCGLCGVAFIRIFYWTEDVMAQLRLSDALTPLMESSGPTATLDEITLAFEGDPDPIALVVRENGDIHGIITGADICSTEIRTVLPDQTLLEALNLFTSQRLRALPVVEADCPRRPAGLLRHADIMRAHAEGVDRRASRDRRQRLRPVRRSDNVRYLELRVSHESSLNGTLPSDLRLREDSVIVPSATSAPR